MNRETFHMANDLDAVNEMVCMLKSAIDNVLSDESLFRFELSVSEALTNLVIHAMTEDKNGDIEILISARAGEVQIEIFDPEGADPFDIKTHAKDLSQIELTAENGRGLGIIMECSDDVSYGPIHKRNRLSLKFSHRS